MDMFGVPDNVTIKAATFVIHTTGDNLDLASIYGQTTRLPKHDIIVSVRYNVYQNAVGFGKKRKTTEGFTNCIQFSFSNRQHIKLFKNGNMQLTGKYNMKNTDINVGRILDMIGVEMTDVKIVLLMYTININADSLVSILNNDDNVIKFPGCTFETNRYKYNNNTFCIENEESLWCSGKSYDDIRELITYLEGLQNKPNEHELSWYKPWSWF